MKTIKAKTEEVSTELMNELSQVLQKYNLGNVHLESIRLEEGQYRDCRMVCQIVTDSRTGKKRLICRTVCD